MAAIDVDPEAVRMALRDFVQQLANAERERVSIVYVLIIAWFSQVNAVR